MSAFDRAHRRRGAGRGFTLLELSVAIALAVIVIGTATAVLATVLRDNRRARIHSTLQRDAELASQLFAQEIRQAGLGVPNGHHISEDCTSGTCSYVYGTGANGTTSDLVFPARRILVAGGNQLGFLGDLPRPDANYNAFGPLHNRNVHLTGIAWHTENNGTCMPPDACTTSSTSQFFPGAAACNVGGELTCPWASRRVAPGEALQIVDGGGNWSHARVDAPLSSTTGTATGLLLDFDIDQSPAANRRWAASTPAAGPAGFFGQGWVTTLDRVFYRVVGTDLMRRQCWGDPDPRNTNWPVDTSNTVPANPVVTPPVTGITVTGTTCLPEEIIARNVQSLAFSYADETGAPLTSFPDAVAKNAIRSVAWTLVLERADPSLSTPVTYTIQGATRIEN